jgi:hypothetical protein
VYVIGVAVAVGVRVGVGGIGVSDGGIGVFGSASVDTFGFVVLPEDRSG